MIAVTSLNKLVTSGLNYNILLKRTLKLARFNRLVILRGPSL